MCRSPSIPAAAVAIISCPMPTESYLVLRRATHPEDPWSGHFSFPGGRKDEQDVDLLATCIRETMEETGILLTADQLLRRLPEAIAGHHSREPVVVQPFLFTLEDRLPLTLAVDEIQGAVWLDADRFRDPRRHVNVEMLPGRLYPAYPIHDYYLWGFTYRLLRSILGMGEHPVVSVPELR